MSQIGWVLLGDEMVAQECAAMAELKPECAPTSYQPWEL
jgi:hypothetical protein